MNKNVFIMILSMLFVCSISTTSCGQKKAQLVDQYAVIENDSCFKACVPDSLSNIIKEAKKIRCEIVKPVNDTMLVDTVNYSDKEMVEVVKFLFYDRNNFNTDIPVRGVFGKWATLAFEYKNKVVYMQLDFGIWKWRLLDSNGRVYCQRDLANKQMLRIVHCLFPKNTTINYYYEFINKEQ